MNNVTLIVLVVVCMRYIIPLLDSLLEMILYFISKISTKIVISSQKNQMDFQKEYGDVMTNCDDNGNQIGFKMDYDELEEMQEEDFEDEDDENYRFIRKSQRK